MYTITEAMREEKWMSMDPLYESFHSRTLRLLTMNNYDK